MQPSDYPEFSTMLEDVYAFYPTAKAPTAGQKAMFFRALRDLSLDDVRYGFDAHMRDPSPRAQYAPLPGAIIAQVNDRVADDGRPEVEEAWAKAMRSADEFETVVWTDEMAQAWREVSPLFHAGDKVGARMAFKDVYARLVDDARRVRRPASWTAALGFDLDRRTLALSAASHLLAPHADQPLIEAPSRLLLAGPGGRAADPIDELTRIAPAEVRDGLLALRARLTGAGETETLDAAGKRHTDELRQRSNARLAEHLGVDMTVIDAQILTTHTETADQ